MGWRKAHEWGHFDPTRMLFPDNKTAFDFPGNITESWSARLSRKTQTGNPVLKGELVLKTRISILEVWNPFTAFIWVKEEWRYFLMDRYNI